MNSDFDLDDIVIQEENIVLHADANRFVPSKTEARFKDDFEFFAKYALKIENNEAQLIPFILKPAQRDFYLRRDKQRKELGFVRLIVVKARQMGFSTVVSGMFLHDNLYNSRIRTYILSHHSDTTKHLFSMPKNYVENLPPELDLPGTITDNAKQFKFTNKSLYTVGTAGYGRGGRGITCQKFHGSEVAFFENEDEIVTGVTQAIGDVPGTDIILESTGNGQSGMFYDKAMDALEGKGSFEVAFYPWYVEPSYTRKAPEDFVLNSEEEEIKMTYPVSKDQLYWRRKKIEDMGSKIWRFKQEYPICIEEAFQKPTGTFLNMDRVDVARKTNLSPHEYEHLPVIAGIDVARSRDRTCIVFRQGRKVIGWYILENDQIPIMVVQTLELLKRYVPEHTFVDYGYAPGFADGLECHGWPNVHKIQFGNPAIRKDLYFDIRSEMGYKILDWFENREEPVDIPDDPAFTKHLMMIPACNDSRSGKMRLPTKDDIRKANKGKSSDIFDSLMLTKALPVCDTQKRYTKVGAASQIIVKTTGSTNSIMARYRGGR